MAGEASTIHIVPLVPNLALPRAAPARTRAAVPPGYGVQEQCLPFTAASALGLLIPSPIRFGHCPETEVPAGCRAFRSPLPSPAPHGEWVFYVEDDPRCGFTGNAYRLAGLPSAFEPGISFFDREDQQDLFKLHLPYVWRTAAEMDLLFVPPLNRRTQGLEVLSGLVEADWYASPVNLILRKAADAVHYQAGEPIAQAILIPRAERAPRLEVDAEHSRLTRETRRQFLEWHARHAADRGAYKSLARSRQGRAD